MRKFYKTILTFAVLSEDESVSTGSLDDLATVAEACDTGDYVGMMLKEEAVELTPAEAAKALVEFGSEPGFFQLDDQGRDLDDDEDEDEDDEDGEEDTRTWRVWDGKRKEFVFISRNEDDARDEYDSLCDEADGSHYVDLSRGDGETIETNSVNEDLDGARPDRKV